MNSCYSGHKTTPQSCLGNESGLCRPVFLLATNTYAENVFNFAFYTHFYYVGYFQSEQMAKLVKIPGIIISASAIRAKATNITIQCRSCRNTISNIPLKPGLEGYAMPRKCPR